MKKLLMILSFFAVPLVARAVQTTNVTITDSAGNHIAYSSTVTATITPPAGNSFTITGGLAGLQVAPFAGNSFTITGGLAGLQVAPFAGNSFTITGGLGGLQVVPFAGTSFTITGGVAVTSTNTGTTAHGSGDSSTSLGQSDSSGTMVIPAGVETLVFTVSGTANVVLSDSSMTKAAAGDGVALPGNSVTVWTSWGGKARTFYWFAVQTVTLGMYGQKNGVGGSAQ